MMLRPWTYNDLVQTAKMFDGRRAWNLCALDIELGQDRETRCGWTKKALERRCSVRNHVSLHLQVELAASRQVDETANAIGVGNLVLQSCPRAWIVYDEVLTSSLQLDGHGETSF